MQRTFFRFGILVNLLVFCSTLYSQTSTPPAFSFSAPQKVFAGTASEAGNIQSQLAVDLNGDGNTDIYGVITTSSGNGAENAFLVGNGEGGFVLKTNSNTNNPQNTNPFFFSPTLFVDLNRDTFPDTLDIYPGYRDLTGCGITQNGSVSVYLGDGQGNFTGNGFMLSVRPFDSVSAVLGDFNNDGLQDVGLVTSVIPSGSPCYSDGYVDLQILVNNGDGTFTARNASLNNISIGLEPDHLIAGDFNGDGKKDVAFVGEARSNSSAPTAYNVIQVLYGNGDGTLKVGPAYTSDTNVDSLLSADLNGDGKTDLVMLTEPKSPSTQYRVASLLAKQTGGFYWASDWQSSTPVQLIGLMDLNNDGKSDLAYYALNGGLPELRVLAGFGAGKFGSSFLIRKSAPYEHDIFAPRKTGGTLDIFYALSYPPNKNVYVYEMVNQSK